MTLQQKLSLKLQQKMILTPTLQQAIRLLHLTRIELQDAVTQEVMENPVLEESGSGEEDGHPTEEFHASPERQEEETPIDSLQEKIDVESYFQDFLETGLKYRGSAPESREEGPDQDRYLSRSENLAEHLLWQVGVSRMSAAEQEIAKFIVGNLGEEGYLSASLEEVAAATGAEAAAVEAVLAKVQLLDPVGVAARDLRECLLIQLKAYGFQGSLAYTVVEGFLANIERESRAQLAQRLHVGEEELAEALRLIKTLDPKPGLKYNQPVNPSIVPDVIVEKVGDEYKISLNEDGMPKLRINTKYVSMAEEGSAEAGQETMTYLKEKMRSALWFLKSIEERQKTIHKVASQLVEFQMGFLEKGPSAMKPLVLKDVAERVGVHESTVSRVVSNKYIQTPRGIFPMKYFFNTGLATVDGLDVSSLKVKERLKNLLDSEDPKKPLSDQKLVEILRKEGVLLARRTVAKYREELHIPSSGRRKAPAQGTS